MRFTFSTLLIILNTSLCFAWQFPSEQWHKGEIVLADLTVRKGELKYDLEKEAVQLRVGDKTETYDASQVSSFVFIQQNASALRVFYSIPYATASGYTRPKFFERFVEGKMTLLGREFIGTTTVANGIAGRSRYRSVYNDPQGITTANYLAFKMYFANDRGQIFESTGRAKDVVEYFDDNQADLKKFIKKEKLRLDELVDVAKLVRHYNDLK